jgi:hypothetical protein
LRALEIGGRRVVDGRLRALEAGRGRVVDGQAGALERGGRRVVDRRLGALGISLRNSGGLVAAPGRRVVGAEAKTLIVGPIFPGLEGVNWVQKEHDAQPPGPDQKKPETKAPGRELRFWIHQPANPRSPLAADVASVRRALDLEPGRDEFVLTEFPYRRQPSEVGVDSRSLLGVLYFLSVEVPAQDVQAGLVTVTEDGLGQPFDWSRITRKIMTIHSQQKRPDNAYVAVQHRGWWFSIADDDHTSKATWSFLSILFALQSASAQGKAPLLTLPIGK